jgi:nucleoside-diphosphate-sugar epimerase
MHPERRVLVTGATGLVGSGVVGELARAGYEVIGVGHNRTAEPISNVCRLQADLGGNFEPAFDAHVPFHGLVHLAAAISPAH